MTPDLRLRDDDGEGSRVGCPAQVRLTAGITCETHIDDARLLSGTLNSALRLLHPLVRRRATFACDVRPRNGEGSACCAPPGPFEITARMNQAEDGDGGVPIFV
jgi:hypothetical protein